MIITVKDQKENNLLEWFDLRTQRIYKILYAPDSVSFRGHEMLGNLCMRPNQSSFLLIFCKNQIKMVHMSLNETRDFKNWKFEEVPTDTEITIINKDNQ